MLDLLEGKAHDLGGFTVRRLLPSHGHRAVGPFVFFDHLGPALLEPVRDGSGGIQVRPHPHIGLATVTYLFEGELVHRDSLGSVQSIRPGDVNWMTAGRGIVHSERSPDGTGDGPLPVHALQSWVALPQAHEDDTPSFMHHPASTLPVVERPGATITIVAGHGFGATSPVAVLMPTLYAVVRLDAGASLAVPDEHVERAAYVVTGDIAIDGERVQAQRMAVLEGGSTATIEASTPATVVLLGGAALDGPRALDWNFVASTRDAIAAAKDAWSRYPSERFPQVPGETEFIPLPGPPVERTAPL